MQQETPVNLLSGDKKGGLAVDYRDALPINFYAVESDLFGTKGYLLQIAGLSHYGTGFGADRGGVWNERHKKHYRVSGERFISVAADGTVEDIGYVFGADDVSLPYSFNTQAIIASRKFYLYDNQFGFREITLNVGDPIDGCWVDSVYFFTDGEYLYHTDFSSESSISSFKYDTSAISPDITVGVARTVDNKVAVFNRYTTEYFQTRGADITAFQGQFGFGRVKGRLLKTGIVGTHCKCEMDGKFMIMGGKKEENVSIHALTVGGTEKLATREVDKIIGKYTEDELGTSKLEARVEDGNMFLIVHLPNETLMLNYTLAKVAGLSLAWSILKSDVYTDTFTGKARDYRAKHIVFDPRRGQWVGGDKETGKLCVIDNEISTHFDELAECVLFTPFLDLETMSIDEIDIETVAGFTTTKDATVAISMTYDGVTYGKEWWAQYGQPSDYGKRFIARRLGYIRDWVGLKFRIASRSRVAFARFKLKYG